MLIHHTYAAFGIAAVRKLGVDKPNRMVYNMYIIYPNV